MIVDSYESQSHRLNLRDVYVRSSVKTGCRWMRGGMDRYCAGGGRGWEVKVEVEGWVVGGVGWDRGG